MKVLIKFNHGLGDSVQLTSVIRHLKHHRHDWDITVASQWGKHTAFKGMGIHSFVLGLEQGHFDSVFDLGWWECYNNYSNCPSTKTSLCLKEVFAIEPSWDLLEYTIVPTEGAVNRVEEYLATLPLTEQGFVVMHYNGNTSRDAKDLQDRDAAKVVDWLTHSGVVVVLLDWDNRSNLADNKMVFSPHSDHPLWMRQGTGCAETITSLMRKAKAAVCIDSGPQKCAFAAGIPVICPWVRHHPVNYVDNAPKAIHLVPERHADYIHGNDKNTSLDYFNSHYQYWTYPANQLADLIVSEVARILGLPYNASMVGSYMLQSKAFNIRYYEEHRRAGLDYLGHGEWQERYGRWIVDALNLKDKAVLDVGCAAGSIACGIAKAGALVSGVDLSEAMIVMGRRKWLHEQLHVCDAVNLHLFDDGTFDMLHSNQVFEHYKPELVPFILKELWRITKPGGVLWVALDTAESFAREGRTEGVNEDATHVCIKPLDWWYQQCAEAGWVLNPELLQKLKDHPDSFYRMYSWDSFLCVKSVVS